MNKQESLRHAFLNNALNDATSVIGRLEYEVRASGAIPETVKDHLAGLISQFNRSLQMREEYLRKALNEEDNLKATA